MIFNIFVEGNSLRILGIKYSLVSNDDINIRVIYINTRKKLGITQQSFPLKVFKLIKKIHVKIVKLLSILVHCPTNGILNL